MSGFNAHGVPWYASGDTPAIRSSEPRELPDWLKEKKVRRGERMQFIYNYIRNEWKVGDTFIVLEPKENDRNTTRHSGRKGIFLGTKMCGAYKFVIVDWEDKKNKINMGVSEFFRFAVKMEKS